MCDAQLLLERCLASCQVTLRGHQCTSKTAHERVSYPWDFWKVFQRRLAPRPKAPQAEFGAIADIRDEQNP